MGKRVYILEEREEARASLRVILRAGRMGWEVRLFSAAEELMGAEVEEGCDVVVVSVDQPEGVELLAWMQAEAPRVIRVAVADQFALHSFLSASPVAHQCLGRPFEPQSLMRLVERALELRESLEGRQWEELLLGPDGLPIVPRLYSRLVCALASREPDVDEIAALIGEDVGICARVLRVVNSAYFGVRRQVQSVREAVIFLGTRMLQELVLSEEVFRLFTAAPGARGLMEALQEHSRETGAAARRLRGEMQREGLFLAGILHEVGTLQVLSRGEWEGDRPVVEALPGARERSWMSAYLMGLWGVSAPITEAVAHHLCPEEAPPFAASLAKSLHVLEAVARGERRGGLLGALHRGCELQPSVVGSSAALAAYVDEERKAIREEKR